MKLTKRKNIDPMHLAWLLRADLRKGAGASAPISDWFRMWWLIHGPREYPAWIDNEALREAGLFEPQEDHYNYAGFGMTPALRFLLETRVDLADAFDVSTNDGLWQAISWLFVHGIREHSLLPALSNNTLDALDAAPPFLANVDTSSGESTEITWLMFFVWKNNPALQMQFDLRREQERQQYQSWFFSNGVPDLALGPLISQRWRDWLKKTVLENHAQASIPRATYMLWQRHQQLQQAFDLRTDFGISAFAMWSEEIWSTQREVAWIDQRCIPPTVKPSESDKRPFGLNLIGFAFGELGIGEDVRMAAEACECAGIPFTVVNIHPGDKLRQADMALAARVNDNAEQQDPAPYAFNLFCLTAFDTARVFLERGSDLFEERYNIGWWPWELPVWPKDWLCVFDVVDEVWAATKFTYQMYLEAVNKASDRPPPVYLVPMPASVARLKVMSRAQLGLPEKKFIFLYVFDFNSYLDRKNPFACVAAFRRAFHFSDTNVALVLKTMNANPDNPRWKHFSEECENDSRIIVIDQTMDRGAVLGLINACDAYVSLHRSEGFGRTLAEAMLFGKPVIATDFSGNTDFLNQNTGFPVEWHPVQVQEGEYPYINRADEAWWADASIDSAVSELVKARTQGLSHNHIVNFAQQHFSQSRSGHNIKQRLSEIFQITHTTCI